MAIRVRTSPVPGICQRLALCLLAISPGLYADVIYLSNGNVMVVEKAWEEGGEILYRTGQGVYRLPKASVHRIQEQRPAESPSTFPQKYGIAVEEQNHSVPKPETVSNVPLTGSSKSVSREVLARLRENVKAAPTDAYAKSELVQALNSMASLQTTQGDLTSAKASLQEALHLDKRNPVLLSNLAIVNFRLSDYRAAEDLLLTCLEVDPKNQTFYYLLGEAYYAQDKISQAIGQWNVALQLGSNKNISERLEKARQEAGTHSELGILQSAHFILRYDRIVSDYQLGQQILTTLENLYRQLSRELTSRPPATVAVILYPDQTYFDITQAPSWTGALFDGKIRVPTKGLSSVTPELTATLTHELTHSFVASLPGRGCPAWFNEGVAQFQEGKSASSYHKWLVQLQKENQLVPLSSLRGPFVGLSPGAAGLAYIEGLSAVEYLISQFGRSGIRDILELMAQNCNFENAFKTALHQSVTEFELSWQQSMRR
jgi:tetratricopeptide (TPR) repeat protein